MAPKRIYAYTVAASDKPEGYADGIMRERKYRTETGHNVTSFHGAKVSSASSRFGRACLLVSAPTNALATGAATEFTSLGHVRRGKGPGLLESFPGLIARAAALPGCAGNLSSQVRIAAAHSAGTSGN